jgi:hypothetical protein
MSGDGQEQYAEQRWRELMELPVAQEGFSVVEWWDATARAPLWFGIHEISPEKAALLLFGYRVTFDEHTLAKELAKAWQTTVLDVKREGDARRGEQREASVLEPAAFDALLAHFRNTAKLTPAPRSLRAWLAIAEAKNLPHHSWVRAYVNEMKWPPLDEPAPVTEQAVTSPSLAESAPPQGNEPQAVGVQGAANTVRLLGRRKHAMTAIFDKARRSAVDPADHLSVFAAMVKLAQEAVPDRPLLGYDSGEGIRYAVDTDEKVRYFTKDHARGWVGRRK